MVKFTHEYIMARSRLLKRRIGKHMRYALIHYVFSYEELLKLDTVYKNKRRKEKEQDVREVTQQDMFEL